MNLLHHFNTRLKCILLSIFSFVMCLGKAQCVSYGTSLATPYTSNNGGKGVMFNVVTTNAISLTCFDLNLVLGSVGSYEVYYKVGSYVGSENNAAAWTLIGSNPSVPCVGFDFPSPLNIPINLFIPAGQTYGFYVTSSNAAAATGVRYINGTAYTTIASDANVAIAGGIGKAYPFGASFINRNFSGTLHYGLGSVLPVELVSFYATPAQQAVRLTWSTASEKMNSHFTVERSVDGISWTSLQTIKGKGDSEKKTDYELTDEEPLNGISYYRLAQTDVDGTTTYSGIRSIERHIKASAPERLVVAPNPATKLATINGSEDELGDIMILSLLGRDLTKDVPIIRDENTVTLDLSRLEDQLLLVRCGSRSALVMKQ